MPPSETAHPAIPRAFELPNVSYGPFRLLEAVPWLMLASAIRFVSYGNGGKVLLGLVFSGFVLFLAYLLAARRMIEFADGRTDLGKLSFREQIKLARRVLGLVALILFAAYFAVLPFDRSLAPVMLLGFDGIAFDQFSKLGMVWSGVVAALVLLMVVKVGTAEKITIRAALRELWLRANWLLPAIVAVAAMQFGLNAIQGVVRGWVYAFWQTSESPQNIKNLVYFAFVFGFATLRLWLTLAILTFALRESYRRDHA